MAPILLSSRHCLIVKPSQILPEAALAHESADLISGMTSPERPEIRHLTQGVQET
jgi:hypothetical protein